MTKRDLIWNRVQTSEIENIVISQKLKIVTNIVTILTKVIKLTKVIILTPALITPTNLQFNAPKL